MRDKYEALGHGDVKLISRDEDDEGGVILLGTIASTQRHQIGVC